MGDVAVAMSVTNRCSLCGHWFTSDHVEDYCEECLPKAVQIVTEPDLTQTPVLKEVRITAQYLRSHPDEIFVFGDNLLRVGTGGAAALRAEPNTYGFVTKKSPTHLDADYYRPDEYVPVYLHELQELISEIRVRNTKTFLISKLGAGLANKYDIWSQVIGPTLKPMLRHYSNVRFLW